MHIVETLLETARMDTDLLSKNDRRGDDFSKVRAVDFLLIAEDPKKAETVAAFIDDCRYGQVHVEQAKGRFGIRVVVEMPTTQNVLCAVSGLMACVAKLFEVTYDGWGCVLQTSPVAPA
ncbi:MAG: ribonuclease E inhibitor RraB [Myxococcaceae bacterium]